MSKYIYVGDRRCYKDDLGHVHRVVDITVTHIGIDVGNGVVQRIPRGRYIRLTTAFSPWPAPTGPPVEVPS